ncbi:FAD-dependent oxidoreductase [Roseomonas hellenica]|uniref:FAD-dependent oxidoreductase n=2 Tax=Plastoroseomonas hellenica TaxID=2687306 RepID=A0ABS5EXE1_9PROT|nr:FAD-dependent oxidoreductase [Plastoroseomonas hellenica]
MEPDYQRLDFAYRRSRDQDAPEPPRHPVVIAGAGPVGLAAAIDLAQRGIPVVLLDDDNRLSTGSRAICFAKRTLEIFDRLGLGELVAAKGVRWNLGKVFLRDALLYQFDLLPEPAHHRPAFVNIQQYYVEGYLAERALALRGLDLRWSNRVIGLEQAGDGVLLAVETPEGSYRLRADWVIAADGGRSPIRAMMGLESKGRVFRDRFLIADVRMAADFPAERWFWFDPPFHPGQSVLLHRQPDNVWRIDFQLGWDADPALETAPERVLPRIRALLGQDARFELEWVSIYTFACRRMEHFRHGRVLFAGDAAHGVSPFGARGANSGVQDADNLAWKLAAVLRGEAPEALLDSYAAEREAAADENLLNSTRATDFITPKSEISRLFRDAVLDLAREAPFARALVNSGRLSTPTVLRDSALNTPDADGFEGSMVPGAPATDAPIRIDGAPGWLLEQIGQGFTLLCFGVPPDAVPEEARTLLVDPAGAVPEGVIAIEDSEGLLARRYDARPGTGYLLRPDQHVCARWRAPCLAGIRHAMATALGWEMAS